MERAAFTMFLVSEVHPCADGNGRIARVMMSAELIAGRQSKIIVPTGFRWDYLGALRRLSRNDNQRVHQGAPLPPRLHARIDWTTHDTAEADLRDTNAIEEADDAPRLRLLRAVPPQHDPDPRPRSHGHARRRRCRLASTASMPVDP